MSSICVSVDATLRGLLGYAMSMLEAPSATATAAPPLSQQLLQKGDDTTSNAIIAAFRTDPTFAAFAKNEMEMIVARDDEDGEKLATGIREAVARGTLDASPPVEPVTEIDVAGKSADAVAAEIVARLGTAPADGCVLVLQGLSGTGKGTTVAKLEALLPKCVCWSNGNVFRSLTLLAVTYCEQQGIDFSPDAITAEVLGSLVKCLTFGKVNGKFDTRIQGFGLDLLVSEVANTTLKEPRVGKNIPTIAKMSQGEVIKFAGAAAEQMRMDGFNVLMEGRAQTLDYVRTRHRFALVLPDPTIIGQRRAAQRMMAAALQRLASAELTVVGATGEAAEVRAALQAALGEMARG